jgi:hypothetical protein
MPQPLDLYDLPLDVLEAALERMSDAELRTAAIEMPVEHPASDIVYGECERRDIDL